MQTEQPSRTALAAAAHRAAHQILEGGRIFSDPLALRILGEHAQESPETYASRRRMRIFIAVRTRFAEDALAAAVTKGVSQLVILGAGLDTFAYRNPFGAELRVFEVDHPATQTWKRRLLAEADITPPDTLTFAPLDFERATLAEGLRAAGFDTRQHSFFTWLGVVPYLSDRAVWSTLEYIASLRNGAHVVFDYSDPPDLLSPEARGLHDQGAERVRALGEAWITHFEAAPLRSRLTEVGFTEVEDLGPSDMAARYFPGFAGSAPTRGGHVLRAAKLGRPA